MSGQIYRSPIFRTGEEVDEALMKALSALQEAPSDGGIYSRQSGKWVRAGLVQKGSSAYEIAVNNGFEGTEEQWLDSLHGENVFDSLQASGAIPPFWTLEDYYNSLKGTPGASFGVQRTLYYAITANHVPDLFTVDLTLPDMLGNTIILNPDFNDSSTLTVTYNGVLLLAGEPGGGEKDWYLDIRNNQVKFTQAMLPGRLVTVTCMIPVEDVEIAPNPLDQIAAFGGWFNPKLTGGGDLPALAYDVYDGASGWSSGNYVIAVADGIYNFTSGQPAGTLTDRSLNIIAGNIIQYDGTQWNPLQKEIYVPPIIVVADENARLTLDPRELQPQQVVYQEDTQNLWRFVPQQLPPNSNMAEDWQALPVSVTAASRKQEITYDPILAGSTEFVWAHNVDDIEVYKNKTERLYPTEYTADGSVVTLLTPTVESDVITLVTRY